MKKSYFILLGFILFNYLNASAQAWEWAKDAFNARCLRTVTDGAGNVYLAGAFTGSCTIPGATISAADSAVFIAKYTDSGQLLWHKKLEADQVELNALQFNNGKVYLGGWFTGILQGDQQLASAGKADIFIAGVDGHGAYSFFMRDGGANDEKLLTMSLYDTHILCGGSYTGSPVLGGNVVSQEAYGAFIARYTPAGVLAWAKSIHPTEANYWGDIHFIKSDNDGNVYVIGSFEGPTDFGGVDSAFYYCQVMVKYDPDGSFNRFMFCAGGYAAWVTGLEFDEDNNIYTLKSAAGNHSHSGTCLTKYSQSCDVLWSKTIGGGWSYGTEGMCYPNSLKLKNGMLYIGGIYSGRVTLPGNALLSGSGAYVIKYDLDGNLLMVRNSNGGSGYGQVGAIDVDNSGNVYLAGHNPAAASFGDHIVNQVNALGAGVIAKLNVSMQESRPSIVLDPASYSECAGKTVIIRATVQNATSIKWYLPGGHAQYGSDAPLYDQNPAWVYDSAGVYSAYVVISNSAYRDSFAYHDIIDIAYPETPVISLSNGTLVCTVQSDSVNGYEWLLNGHLVSYGPQNTCSLMGDGEYKARVSFMNGCYANSEIFHYTAIMAAEEVTASDDISVIPNPGNGDFDIQLPAGLKSKKVQITLIDFAGRVVEKKVVECCEGRESMHVRGIAKGVYFLTVEGGGVQLRQKVVVQ